MKLTMRCHYEVLSVSHNADDCEIKKSYRKLALLYHPDKNPDNIDEVTELFREVQSAYDVLSDPQERAWYDKHREAILKGGGDYIDDTLDLMHYFNPSVFYGFDDGAKSFYTVFRDAFSKLSKEDEPYMEDDCEEITAPEFGYSCSDYETVVKPFYIYWLAYQTKKSYVWKAKYDIRQAANRPTQRLMEKENKKLRDLSRRKRNEEVRALVTYVRKRDKRVQEEIKKMKLKQEEQQRKAKEIQEMQKKDRSKLLDNYEEQEWMAFDDSKLDDIDSHYDNMFGPTMKDDSDESDYENILYCIACDKNFKSDKALANHEKSKKHKENVELIKNELEEDIFEELHIRDHNEEIHIDQLADHICEDYGDEYYDKDSALSRLSSFNLPANIVKRNVIEKNSKSGEDYSMSGGKKTKKKKKKRGNVLIDITEDSHDDIDDSDTSEEKKSLDEDNNEDNDKNDVKQEITDTTMGNHTTQENSDIHNVESVNEICFDNNIAAEICVDETSSSKDNPNKNNENKKTGEYVDEIAGSFNCEICTKVFPTRNKLFKHIKAEGHAMLKEEAKKSKKSKGKKK